MGSEPWAVASLGFGLASAASWGAGDFSGGLATRRAPAVAVVLGSQLVGLGLLVALAIALGEPRPPATALAWGAAAGLAGAGGLLALYAALARSRMGVAAPVSGVTGAVLPVAVGALVEGFPGVVPLAGFALALVAVWLLASPAAAPAGARAGDLGLPLLAGVCLGVFLLLMDRAGAAGVLWPLTAGRLASVTLLAAVGLAGAGGPLPARPELRLTALAGIFDAGGNAFFVLATRAGRLDVAAVLSSLYPASTVLLAWLVLGERLTPRQAAGVVAALAAIPCITA